MNHGCRFLYYSRLAPFSGCLQSRGALSQSHKHMWHSASLVRMNALRFVKKSQVFCSFFGKNAQLLPKCVNPNFRSGSFHCCSSPRIFQILATSYCQRVTVCRQQPLSTFASMASVKQCRYVGEVREDVTLTAEEERIFSTLLEVVRHFELTVQLRVAGGWVRDKLVGITSHDIDIALDSMMGEEFAKKINAYLELQRVETRNIGVIKSNPDQSKHLETATMQVHGKWIDFVNLRAETYADNSRIPDMAFGTAEQDAYRRDLTINSLFYNISTGEVEDLTGQGIPDLKAGLIRTPLPPIQTFLDDPLRVLRAVRFAARFGFSIDRELKEAAQLDEVQSALGMKVSRERIGIEVEKMLGGRDPVLAMHYLAEFRLFSTVFKLPPQTMPEINVDFGRRCVLAMEDVFTVLSISGWMGEGKQNNTSILNEEEKISVLLAALLLPLRKTFFLDKKKKKKEPVSSSIIRGGLKQKAAYADKVALLHNTAEEWQSLKHSMFSIDTKESANQDNNGSQSHNGELYSGREQLLLEKQRISLGLLIRKVKGLWRPALLLSSVLNHAVTKPFQEGEGEEGSRADEREERESGEGCEQSSLKRMRSEEGESSWKELETLVVDFGLDKAWEIKPLLAGKTIINILGLKNAGPLVGKWAEKAMEWQLAHPKADAEECTKWLQEEYASHQETAIPNAGGKSR